MDAEARESINKSRRKAGKGKRGIVKSWNWSEEKILYLKSVVLNTKFCVSLDYDDFQQILKY